MNIEKIIYFLLILNLGLLSCVDDASVRVMPEFNCKDTKVNLAKSGGVLLLRRCYIPMSVRLLHSTKQNGFL